MSHVLLTSSIFGELKAELEKMMEANNQALSLYQGMERERERELSLLLGKSSMRIN